MKRAPDRLALTLGWLLLPALSLSAAPLDDVREIMTLAPNLGMHSPQREALDDFVYAKFKATGFECGRIEFPTAVFSPGEAKLTLPDGTSFTLHAIQPNGANLGNLPGRTWSGSLVDAGRGLDADYKGISVEKSAVLMDMASRQSWLKALELGADVMIFAGGEIENNRESVAKLVKTPIAAPRYYLTHADAVQLREKMDGRRNLASATIEQTRPNRWIHAVGRNEWVIFPGTDQAETVIHLQSYKDAASLVPAFTPGAHTAANLSLLLRLVDHYKANPPQCTLVLSAVSDHCNYMRGEMFYMGSVFNDPTAFKDEMEQRNRDLKEATFYARIYADRSPEMIERLRDDKEWVEGRNLFLKQPISQEVEYQRNRLRHRVALISDALERPDLDAARQAELTAEQKGLTAHLEDVIAAGTILNRFGASRSFSDLTPTQQDLFRDFMGRMERKYLEKAEDAQAGIDRVAADRVIADKLKDYRKHLLYMPIDITFGAEKLGFFFQGSDVVGGSKWPDVVFPFGQHSVQVAGRIEGSDRFFADTIRTTGGIPWRNYLPGKFPLAANLGFGVDVPGVGLTTTEDTRDLLFTPSDTLENLDQDRVAAMMDYAQRLLIGILADPGIVKSTRPTTGKSFDAITLRYNLRRIDPYSVEVPTEPVADALVVSYASGLWAEATEATSLTTNPEPFRGQVCSRQSALTDRQGAAFYRGTSKMRHIEAYGFDPETGAINSVIDAGSGARRLDPKLPVVLNVWHWIDHIALMFDCVETDLIGMYDPATRAALSLQRGQKLAERITLLDAIREASPDHYGIAGIRETRSIFWPVPEDVGVSVIFTEPEVPVKVICDKFLLLNADADHPEGRGFYPGDPRLRMISYTSAQDVQVLNGVRSQRLISKGVTIPTARALYADAEKALEEAGTARKEQQESRFMKEAILSLSYAVRSYLIVRTTTMDLVKAIAVFLALVIPFCVFLTKLLTPWTDIRAQIGVFVGVFAVMAFGLAMLHPAFSLSQTPMMVLLAFAMVGLAVFVMMILHTRFDSNLRRMVEEAQGVESTESSRSTLAGVAFSVGVNNMRRRRIRTTLTAATIVLVTFTMLSVISVGQSQEAVRRKITPQPPPPVPAPYNGVLFAKPGMAPIFDSEMDHVVSLLEPYGQVVCRTWTQRLDADGGYMPVPLRDPENPAAHATLSSILGVQTQESGFALDMPLAAGRWFSANDAREILLSVDAAALMGITPENFQPRDLIVRTDRLKLVGLLHDEPLVNAADLAALPWLPLQSIPDPTTRAVSETGEMNISAEDAAGGPAPRAFPLRAIDVGLVPIDYAMTLPFTSYRSIAVKCPEPAKAWECAQFFVGATSMVGSASNLTYTGLQSDLKLENETIRAGQYALGAPEGGDIGGAGKVAIPVCLAATIILNTMLGAVMERRKEISVYNSIGLNPTHVFVFFVAEAVVFGLIGSVAGYLIGQALSQIIVHFNLLDVNLNYSSMAVMLVIFAAIATVVVSTLYPAYIATQASVPSGQRKWKLPTPSGDDLLLKFPFSFTEDQLPGVCAFLHQFMDLNSEASSGQFLAQDARFGHIRDVEGRKVLVMVYNVTPIPFDLGVNQRMEIYGYYDPKVRACVLATNITRTRGSDSSWLVVNQPFLESLRARLLSWRSQSAANQEQFRIQGEKIFAGAPELPTRGVSAA